MFPFSYSNSISNYINMFIIFMCVPLKMLWFTYLNNVELDIPCCFLLSSCFLQGDYSMYWFCCIIYLLYTVNTFYLSILLRINTHVDNSLLSKIILQWTPSCVFSYRTMWQFLGAWNEQITTPLDEGYNLRD